MTTLSAGSASIDIPQLADLSYEKSLGTARFMKSIKARHRQGLVFVKAIVKPYPSMVLTPYLQAIERERNVLAEIPNALEYRRILETGSGGYLLRQYIHSSVYDRLSTRPFLEDIEKRFLAFQLLSALRDCHSRDVFHGDIKTENLLVTSWNWLYLTDFSSSFKPTFLPEDNPADFSFYFDTSGRRTCYLAPERFLAAGEEPTSAGVTWAMDIFSAGCVIAELFLEGPIFSLSQIFKYRSGEYSPEHSQLAKIEDPDIRDLIVHMIQLDPESRYSADEYLNFWRRKAFPEYFYGFLHQYMGLITDPSSGRTPINFENGNSGEADEKIDRIYLDFDKISYFLGYGKLGISQNGIDRSRAEGTTLPTTALPGKKRRTSMSQRAPDDGSLIFLSVISSSIRNTAKASARVRACDLLTAFASRLPDEAKLDRVLPYLVSLLVDKSDSVKVAALRSLTDLLASVKVVSPVNASIFQDYIFPRLRPFVLTNDATPSPLVRATYAANIASLAQSSSHMLDLVQAVRTHAHLTAAGEDDWANDHSYHTLFDFARSELVAFFEEHSKALLTDPDASVRRAFLGSVSALCVFFGSVKANDVILSHLNTYLNEKDWILKCAFFEALVGVAAYVGSVSLETFILPLMVQSLTDPEDFVIERVLRSLAGMADLGLFQRSTTWDLLYIVVRLLVHPSLWVREAAVQFVVSSSRFATPADKYCIIFPMVQLFLKMAIKDITEAQILDALKRPLPKAVLDMTITWAGKTEKGIFWKSVSKENVFALPGLDVPSRPNLLDKKFLQKIPQSDRNDEDDQWLAKLQGLGMQQEDEFKLMALRSFIWRVNQRTPKDGTMPITSQLGSVMKLSNLNVNPTTIIFDEAPQKLDPAPGRPSDQNGKQHTLADALLDASTTIDQSSQRVKSRSIASPAKHVESNAQPMLASSDGQASSLSSSPRGPGQRLIGRKEGRTVEVGSTGESLSPSGSDRIRGRQGSDALSLRHKSSAMLLMNRNENAKADAATATTSTTAIGKLDHINTRPSHGPSTLSMVSARQRSKSPLSQISYPDSQRVKASHSYTGNDPTVLRLLDNVFLENYPVDILEYGPAVSAIDPRQSIKRASDPASTGPGQINHQEPWHPNGRLVVSFGEHSAPVNCVCIAPDHAFFITASDDSTIRIWDAIRLEKNLTPRSRQTYRHTTGAKVKSACFIEETHSFVSGADDGSIHVVKIEYRNIGGESTRYGKPQLLQEFDISAFPKSDRTGTRIEDRSPRQKEYATYLEHHRTESSVSTIFILTNESRLIALDLKTMQVLYNIQLSAHYGIPTSFCLDRRNNWILIGTTHGIISLWDLRFRLRLRSWGIQGGTPVRRIILHPNKGRGRWVIVAGGARDGEITVWDIEKMVCREVYRTSPPGYRPGSKDIKMSSGKAYEPWFPDELPEETLLARFAATTTDRDDGPQFDPMVSPRSNSPSPSPSMTTSLFVGTDVVYPSSTSTGGGSTTNDGRTPVSGVKTTFILSGSADRKLRFWDTNNPAASSIVSGQELVVDERENPRYETSHLGGNTLVVTEWRPSSSSAAPGTSSKGKSRAGLGEGDGIGKERERERSKIPRSELIPRQQQQLLRTHMDAITDCAILQRPYGMAISTDRMGCVYVFQ